MIDPHMAGSSSSSAAKAAKCLANAPEIPGWTLLTMGGAAVGFKSDFDVLQNAIDYLTCKAKAKMAFTDEEKNFLTNIFEDLWWGGQFKGYPEAAKLADHYVNGKGELLRVDAAVYQGSVIVKDTSAAIKAFVRHQILKNGRFAIVSSSDAAFRHSTQFKHVSRSSKRDVQRQGYVLPDDYLLTEQSNSRLKNANNRFILVAHNSRTGGKSIATRWRVDDDYEFEPFERAGYYTNIPLSDAHVLKLPDGLSHYMTVLGIAAAFHHYAEWTETWNL